jgi:hypothetical protein
MMKLICTSVVAISTKPMNFAVSGAAAAKIQTVPMARAASRTWHNATTLNITIGYGEIED